MKLALSFPVRLSICTFSTLFATCKIAQAQVTSDGTVNTQVNQNGNVSEITGGETKGSNLFHSFREFSIQTGNEAFFNNAEAISNIFSRVTGGNVSNIDGLIRANSSASLFLINPAGIVFGENARLDIGGSFYGSSAASILFEDGEFSATDLDNPPLLTIKAPIGLSFRDNPGSIDNNSVADDNSALSVSSGATLALLGGEINFTAGKIIAPGANVFIGGLLESGTIGFDENFNPIFPEGVALADVSLSNAAKVDVRAAGGGSITVNAQNLELREGSWLFAGIAEGVNAPTAQAGNISLNIVEKTTIDGAESGIFNNVGEAKFEPVLDDEGEVMLNDEGEEVEEPVSSSTLGNAGKIDINTGSLFITPGSRIGSTIFGQGNAGDVAVNARERIEIDGGENRANPTGIFSNLEVGAIGNSGTIRVFSDSFFLSDRGQLRTSIGRGAEGTAGDILVTTNALTLKNSGTRFTTTVGGQAMGTGGDIIINADTVTFTPGSQLSAEMQEEAEGSSGDIEINANSLILDAPNLKEESRAGSTIEIQTEIEGGAIGDAGDIRINTTNLVSLSGSSALQTTIKRNAQGNAGDIIINTGTLSLDKDADIQNSTGKDSIGDAGRVEINADTVRINEGAKILSSTRGQGDAGAIEINASDSVIISGFSDLLLLNRFQRDDSFNLVRDESGEIINNFVREGGSSGLFATVADEASGRGGNIRVTTPNLQILDGAVISADVGSEAQGQGGSIFIDADTLEIRDGGQIIASSLGIGNSGEINLDISDSIEIFGSDPTFAQRFQAEVRSREPEEIAPEGIVFEEPLTEAEGREKFNSVGVGDDSQISGIYADNEGQGNGGVLSIRSGSLILDDGAQLSASTESGRGGNINLAIDDALSLNGNSTISARAFNTADGGNIEIDTDFIVAFPSNGNGSDIVASAEQGNGGNITINAESLLGIVEGMATDNNNTNDLDASSEFGLAGTVSVITPDVDILQGVTELPRNVVEPQQTTTQACAADRESANQNSLRIQGRGGVPPAPDLPLNADNIIVNGEPVATSPDYKIKPIKTGYGDIIPARGVVKTEDGRVILTAYPTDNNQRISQGSPNCGKS